MICWCFEGKVWRLCYLCCARVDRSPVSHAQSAVFAADCILTRVYRSSMYLILVLFFKSWRLCNPVQMNGTAVQSDSSLSARSRHLRGFLKLQAVTLVKWKYLLRLCFFSSRVTDDNQSLHSHLPWQHGVRAGRAATHMMLIISIQHVGATTHMITHAVKTHLPFSRLLSYLHISHTYIFQF